MEHQIADYRRRVRRTLIGYAAAFVVVTALTLIAGLQDNPITTSMSAMGSSSAVMHVVFIVWTIAFCAYFGSLTGFILVLTQNTRSRIKALVLIAVAIMIVGDILPFVPEEHPLIAYLHDICAQIASVSLAATLMLLAMTVRKSYHDVFSRALVWVLVIWILLLTTMGLIGTKALTEMFGVIGGSLYLLAFARWIERAAGFDAKAALSANDAEEAEENAKRLEKKAAALELEFREAQQKARRARVVAQQLRRIERRSRRQSTNA